MRLVCGLLVIILMCSGCVKDSPEEDEYVEVDAPDFKSYTDAQVKKHDFLAFLYPMVVRANLEVINELKVIARLSEDSAPGNKNKLQKKCEAYKIDCKKATLSQISEMLSDQLGIVPPSIALAQAANESGWGTSRFAREANNYFGQWCFTAGCGLVPKKREQNEIHEVRVFNSVMASMRSYLHNLNTSHAYEGFRAQRSRLQAKGRSLYGNLLVQELTAYSERGEAYVKEIKQLMRQNKLKEYDEKFLLALSEK